MYGYSAGQPWQSLYTQYYILYCVIMQAVPMSKQVNRVNIEPEILYGNWSSYWKYNFFVNPFTSCKTDIIICVTIHYNAGHTYTMQELVKEVTLINHSNNGFAILHGIN